jgi:heme/copper-type cytochrome/quinol oxidase subunit 3
MGKNKIAIASIFSWFIIANIVVFLVRLLSYAYAPFSSLKQTRDDVIYDGEEY